MTYETLHNLQPKELDPIDYPSKINIITHETETTNDMPIDFVENNRLIDTNKHSTKLLRGGTHH